MLARLPNRCDRTLIKHANQLNRTGRQYHFFEQMILTASPVELIRMLYQRAIASVREARQHLENRRIVERGNSINRAYLILVELSSSLRTEEAPQLAARLRG